MKPVNKQTVAFLCYSTLCMYLHHLPPHSSSLPSSPRSCSSSPPLQPPSLSFPSPVQEEAEGSSLITLSWFFHVTTGTLGISQTPPSGLPLLHFHGAFLCLLVHSVLRLSFFSILRREREETRLDPNSDSEHLEVCAMSHVSKCDEIY